MNRSDRRKAKKLGYEVPDRVPTYQVTKEQLQEVKDNATEEAMNVAFTLLLCLPANVLHDKFGFGQKRLTKFTDEVMELYKAFEEGYFTLKDCEEMMEKEVGISFWPDAWKKMRV